MVVFRVAFCGEGKHNDDYSEMANTRVSQSQGQTGRKEEEERKERSRSDLLTKDQMTLGDTEGEKVMRETMTHFEDSEELIG